MGRSLFGRVRRDGNDGLNLLGEGPEDGDGAHGVRVRHDQAAPARSHVQLLVEDGEGGHLAKLIKQLSIQRN